MAGVNATVSVGYPTTDADAQNQKTRTNPANNGQTDWLEYLLSDGATLNLYEAYIDLPLPGDLYLFLPEKMELFPLAYSQEFAFRAIYEELLDCITRGGIAHPTAGTQQWVNRTTGAQSGPVAFPISIP